jgi:hypothetical protein
MKRIRGTWKLSLVAMALAADAGATGCTLKPLQPTGDTLQLSGVGQVSLGAADDSAHPRAWQGPIAAGACTLDLGIIEAPFLTARPGALFITTYSGALRTVSLVDFGACKVIWQSTPLTGAVRTTPAGLQLGEQRIALNARCLPKAHR